MTTLRAACFSDLGKVRKENEDRMLFDVEAKLFGVADGVGGLPGGGEAAQETVNVVTAAVLATPPDAELDLRGIVTLANSSVAALGVRMSPGLGIGSTLTSQFPEALAHGREHRSEASRHVELPHGTHAADLVVVAEYVDAAVRRWHRALRCRGDPGRCPGTSTPSWSRPSNKSPGPDG